MIAQEERLDNTKSVLKQYAQEITQQKNAQDIKEQLELALQKINSLKKEQQKNPSKTLKS
ncbi:hypothetical protein KVE05_00625 [Helicobacter pylori]|nr:hypothetical protein KVE05_00625 [Helicobacter pylori]